MKTGIELIAQEREEQIEKHGRTIDADVKNNKSGELSFAAAALSCPNPESMGLSSANNYSCPTGWDVKIWTKMILKPYKDRLIIAGALLAAEIDRLQARRQ
jgi:hypothetical protein